jgi:hypothetical protein
VWHLPEIAAKNAAFFLKSTGTSIAQMDVVTRPTALVMTSFDPGSTVAP